MDETGDTPPARREIAGFWRRLIALAIDGALLGVAGMLLGWLWFDVFARMGEAARLIGLAIAWPYLGLLNSRLAGGRTAGKWLLGLRVVGADGAPLDVAESMLRALILLAPLLLNGATLAPIPFGVLGFLQGLIVFGGFGSLAYLYVFNRRTRQSLHDLAVGSYVIRDDAEPAALPPIWKGHLWIVAGLFLVVACLPLLTLRLLERQPFAGLVPAQHAVVALPWVQTAGVHRGFMKMSTGERTDWVRVTVRSRLGRVLDDEGVARDVARLVIDKYPQSREQDMVIVNLVYGYDIGIASGWRSHQYNFPMRDERTKERAKEN